MIIIIIVPITDFILCKHGPYDLVSVVVASPIHFRSPHPIDTASLFPRLAVCTPEIRYSRAWRPLSDSPLLQKLRSSKTLLAKGVFFSPERSANSAAFLAKVVCGDENSQPRVALGASWGSNPSNCLNAFLNIDSRIYDLLLLKTHSENIFHIVNDLQNPRLCVQINNPIRYKSKFRYKKPNATLEE